MTQPHPPHQQPQYGFFTPSAPPPKSRRRNIGRIVRICVLSAVLATIAGFIIVVINSPQLQMNLLSTGIAILVFVGVLAWVDHHFCHSLIRRTTKLLFGSLLKPKRRP